jgi:general secretion pathway protein G
MNARGFTLIELVVTLALLGVMALLAAPLAELSVKRTREQELRLSLREIRSALDQYKAAADQGLIERKVGDSGYPPDLETMVNGVRNQKSPGRELLVFLRRVPRDPLASPGDEAGGWGLRSFASSAASPAPGADVFDVYSRAPGIGLDGRPYRDW